MEGRHLWSAREADSGVYYRQIMQPQHWKHLVAAPLKSAGVAGISWSAAPVPAVGGGGIYDGADEVVGGGGADFGCGQRSVSRAAAASGRGDAGGVGAAAAPAAVYF